jgi:hypothetical protein
MKNKSRLVSLGAVAVAAMSGPTLAADLPKEGSYDYTVCFVRNSMRIDYSKAQFAYSYEESGTAVSKVPGGLFDKEAVRCVGMTASLDGKRTGGSLCEGLAADGDKRLTRFWYDSDGKFQREQVAGTGKYDGMITTGSVKALGPPEEIKPGTVKVCNQATGTYKLK